MSLWVRLLILATFSTFGVTALTLIIKGDHKAGIGALVVTGALTPLLFEALWPGKYKLRKPDGDLEDNLVNRVRQFRTDHPGLDGAIFLGMLILLGVAPIVAMLVRIFRTLLSHM
jgi:hypothetical protein